jgi:hypothetical protein
MGAMNRVVLALVIALCAAAATVPAAAAKTPCRNLIYNDWYQDGQIASTYPISCYRDALRHLGSGDQVYTSLEDDIRAAMQAALARQHGKKVADQVGHKFTTPVLPDATSTKPKPVSRKDEHPDATQSQTPTQNSRLVSSATPVAASDGGGGVPAPLLILGGLALVLLAAGAAGTLARRRR